MLPHLDTGPEASGEWECAECGYAEEGVPSRRPKRCPECGAPGTALDFFSSEEDAEWDEDEDDLDWDEDDSALDDYDEEDDERAY